MDQPEDSNEEDKAEQDMECLPGEESAVKVLQKIEHEAASELRHAEIEAQETSGRIAEASRVGAGMFTESYFIFSIGNLHALWQVEYPPCFDESTPTGPNGTQYLCNDTPGKSLTYVEVASIITGMLTFGLMGTAIGRRTGSRVTVTLMGVGAIVMISAAGPPDLLLAVFAAGLAILAVGVGGEYPLTSSNSAEAAEAHAKPYKRGFAKSASFAMQGWGNLINTLVIFIITVANGSSVCVPGLSSPFLNSSDCSYSQLEQVWRMSYAVGLLFVLFLGAYRFLLMPESEVWKKRQEELKKMDPVVRRKERHMALHVFTHEAFYLVRLLACASCWYVWDIVFYGNRLFQSTIIAITLGGHPSLYDIYSYTLLNSFIAVIGYYFCAFFIDNGIGFMINAALFLTCGYYYNSLVSMGSTASFQALYYLTTFFGQFGPNGTTFILPSELFPTDIRTTTHGISASCGQLGALTSTLVFTYGNGGKPLANASIFLVNGYAALVGLIITALFIPNTTTLAMKEVDKLWEARLLGKTYEGPATEYANLSNFEAMFYLGVCKPTWLVPNGNAGPGDENRSIDARVVKGESNDMVAG